MATMEQGVKRTQSSTDSSLKPRIEWFFQIKGALLVAVLSCSLMLYGCDSVARHQAATLLFDGVPALPDAEQLCDEYYEQRLAAETSGQTFAGVAGETSKRGSEHKPYVEKQCNDCHSSNKGVDDGLIAPKRELCLVCHTGFVTGTNVHGPVAVGDCLACHVPHTSNEKSLLLEGPERICETCHKEQRLAEAMHQRFVTKGIGCGECHDPHSGNVHYFLK